jgi:hypothetical protein
MNERPPPRERQATNSKLVLAVLLVTFAMMLGAIYLVIRSGKL